MMPISNRSGVIIISSVVVLALVVLLVLLPHQQEASATLRLTACGTIDTIGIKTESHTDANGNKVEVVCNAHTFTRTTEGIPPFFYHMEQVVTIIRFEVLYYPTGTGQPNPIIIGYCPYEHGHNRFNIEYADDDEEEFSKIYWRSYNLPTSARHLDINATHGQTFNEMEVTDFIFDVEEEELTEIVSSGRVTVEIDDSDGRGGYEMLRHNDFYVQETVSIVGIDDIIQEEEDDDDTHPLLITPIADEDTVIMTVETMD